jgi:mannose/cellobiose epimerase-like protein (N-acyl-D-glucosamine 2-epimerase family)
MQDPNFRAAAQAARDKLIAWLNEAAYPLWSNKGVDFLNGGFHEALDIDGVPVDVPRRARVQPRQVYAFVQASRLGWDGDTTGLLAHGLGYFLSYFRRPDGLFRAVVLPNGTPVDDAPVLYDQAFALLGFAAAADLVSGAELDPRNEADRLRLAILRHFKREDGGFESVLQPGPPLQSNPHMHLFEATLAWHEKSGAAQWRALADEIGKLAVGRLLDAATGVMRENFAGTWSAAPGLAGRIVEPGHQFEWAWLLLRWAGPSALRAGADDAVIVPAARRLMEVGETHGVRQGVAVNALLDDFSVHDAAARLWPQAERLKASALAARLFDEERYWRATVEAATTLTRFLATPVRGLWYDKLLPSGEFVREAAPASSFYHIVDAISELAALV